MRRALPVALAVVAAALFVLLRPVGRGMDVCTYYCAGLVAREQSPPAAFDRDTLDRRHALYHPGRGKLGAFLYSPIYLVPARALAALPLERAEDANYAAAVAALALGLAAVLARLRKPLLQGGVAAAFVLCQPVAALFGFGNWTYFAFLWLAVAAWLSSRGRPLAAAPFWALAVHLKLYFGLPLVALWLAGRRKEVVATAGWIAGLAIAFLPWTGFAAWAAFARGLVAAGRLGALAAYNAVSIASAVARFLAPKSAWVASPEGLHGPIFVALAVAGLAALAGLLAYFRRDAERGTAATLVWLLLFGPLAWDHLELLLFVALPALAPAAGALLAFVLGATLFYGPAETRAVVEGLAGRRSELAVEVLLLFYPLVNFLALALLFGAARAAREAESAAGGTAGADDA